MSISQLMFLTTQKRQMCIGVGKKAMHAQLNIMIACHLTVKIHSVLSEQFNLHFTVFYLLIISFPQGSHNMNYCSNRDYQLWAVITYTKSLRFGCSLIYQSMSRILTLWLDYGKKYHSYQSTLKSPTPAQAKVISERKTILDKMNLYIGMNSNKTKLLKFFSCLFSYLGCTYMSVFFLGPFCFDVFHSTFQENSFL